MDNLFLIYVNHLGANWQSNNVYEFIFSDTIVDVDGDDWDTYPASNGDVSPPDVDVIKSVGLLETDLKFDVIRDSDTFSVWDCVDGITPLAYENIMDYQQYPDNRLVFHFGTPISKVKEILYGRDIILEFKKIKNED